MVSRWSWVTLASALLVGFLGCSGKKSARPKQSPSAVAGKSSSGAGASAADAGEGGAPALGGHGGTDSAGRGGSSGASGGTGGGSAGGVGGTGGAGGTGGVGGAASSAGMGARGGSGGKASAGGSAGMGGAPLELPANWSCGPVYYADGFCDCGCGAPDKDCDSEKSDACESCPFIGCGRDFCGTIDPDDNTICTEPPESWKCNERLYRDGSSCDCGCGVRDPDCTESGVDACDKCNGEGSCSGLACPGIIEPTAIHTCFEPTAPDDWTCEDDAYGDGSCECGCGARDADCRSEDFEDCELCYACGVTFCVDRPDVLDPEDTTKCAAPPEGWVCSAFQYTDAYCDCGCGMPDPACAEEAGVSYCFSCGGCALGHCERIDPMNLAECAFDVPGGWSCAKNTYEDDVCDCGCGVRDPDCLSAEQSDCDFCDQPGSCSERLCLDPDSDIDPHDNSGCTG